MEEHLEIEFILYLQMSILAYCNNHILNYFNLK